MSGSTRAGFSSLIIEYKRKSSTRKNAEFTNNGQKPLHPCVPEATLIPICFLKGIHNFQLGLINLLNDHLSNPVTSTDRIRSLPKVNERDPYLTSVISVDRSRRVYDTYAVLKGKAASRTNLCLKARRESDSDPCWDHRNGTFRENLVFFYGCTEVHPG